MVRSDPVFADGIIRRLTSRRHGSLLQRSSESIRRPACPDKVPQRLRQSRRHLPHLAL